jgi:hypothetical protein
VDIIVKIMIVDWQDVINITDCMIQGHCQFFCYYLVTIYEQILPHTNIRINLPIKGTIIAHRNANAFLEDLLSKDFINIVFKKGKHTHNV